MKDFTKGVAQQATAIAIAAIGAAAIAFFSSVAGEAGLQCTPAANPEQAGALGAMFKGIHSAIVMGRISTHA